MAPVRIASPSAIAPGSVAAFTVAGTPVVVANVAGTFYALNNICSHAHALLSEGELDSDDCTLTCPLHGSAFDLTTGEPLSFPAYAAVARYAVQATGDDLFVDLGESQT